MAKSGTFKSAMFGGFRKSAVLDYIEDYQRDSQNTIASLNTELEECRKQYQAAASENEELARKVDECETALAELRELAGLLTEKLKEQTDLHTRIGDVYVEAKADARRIIEHAGEDAKTILEAADTTASMTVDHISDTVSHLKGIQTDFESLVHTFSEKIAQIDRSLSSAKAKISSNKAKKTITSEDLESNGVLPLKRN